MYSKNRLSYIFDIIQYANAKLIYYAKFYTIKHFYLINIENDYRHYNIVTNDSTGAVKLYKKEKKKKTYLCKKL